MTCISGLQLCDGTAQLCQEEGVQRGVPLEKVVPCDRTIRAIPLQQSNSIHFDALPKSAESDSVDFLYVAEIKNQVSIMVHRRECNAMPSHRKATRFEPQEHTHERDSDQCNG